MNHIICVNGMLCTVTGDESTVFIPDEKIEKQSLTKDKAKARIHLHLKAARVWQYLINEGFVTGKIQPKIAHSFTLYGKER